MKPEDVRSIARSQSIKSDHLSKSALIGAIQIDEGNFDCYATAANGECDQSGCLWREDRFDSARHKGELS